MPEKTNMNNPNQNNPQDPQWYDEVIASYDYQSPKTGQIIEGTLIRIDEEGALVDIGVKRDAHVSPRDLTSLDDEFLSNLQLGQKLLVYVTQPASGDRELQVSISKAMEYRDWQEAEKLLESKESSTLEIVGFNRGGLIVQFKNLRGFLPFSQVPELRAASNPKIAETLKRGMVNKSLDLKVIEVVPDRNRLIFSALEAQSEKRKKRLASLEKGQIIEGKVASIVDFGVFVDLDGVDGLVHISQMAWKKIKHPSELAKIGDTMDVKITDVDLERERVSLSRKVLLPSPWEMINELYHTGDYIEVTITRVVDFGAFARLDEGIEGLIHSSQIGYSATQSLKEAVKSGDKVLVKVLDVNPERRRMALSMRQVPLEKQISWAMENLPPPPKAEPKEQPDQLESIPPSQSDEPFAEKTEEDSAPPEQEQQADKPEDLSQETASPVSQPEGDQSESKEMTASPQESSELNPETTSTGDEIIETQAEASLENKPEATLPTDEIIETSEEASSEVMPEPTDPGNEITEQPEEQKAIG